MRIFGVPPVSHEYPLDSKPTPPPVAANPPIYNAGVFGAPPVTHEYAPPNLPLSRGDNGGVSKQPRSGA